MMNEKHSSVCYIFREGAFSPVREAKPFRNDFGLELFQLQVPLSLYEFVLAFPYCFAINLILFMTGFLFF